MTAPHEDDLRAALHDAQVGVTMLERAIELAAGGQENGPEVTAAAERLYAALVAFGTAPRCALCCGDGRYGEDVICGCPAGDSFRNVPVGKPTPEVKGQP